MRTVLQRTSFLTDRLSVTFTTRGDFVRSVLPPGLEPVESPTAVASMSRCQSDCCGTFNYATLSVACQHRGVPGLYPLWMITDADPANQLGRDLWGEPKKLGSTTLFHEPAGMHGIAVRGGVTVIEVEADLRPAPDHPSHQEGIGFELKAQPSVDGTSLQYDPVLVAMHTRDEISTARTGTALLTLRGTRNDPLDGVPVLTVDTATHLIADSWTTAEEVDTFPDRDRYLPYVYGRNFDVLSDLPRPRAYAAARDNERR